MSRDHERARHRASVQQHPGHAATPGKHTALGHDGHPSAGRAKGSLFTGQIPWSNGPTDAVLSVSPKRVEFPRTYVKTSSTRAVVIRNDGDRDAGIEGVAPVGDDLSREFLVHEPRSILLKPGEAAEVPIEY